MNHMQSIDCEESDLACLLTLEPGGPDHFHVPRNDSNVGGEVFGGQYLGQAMSAALATADGRAPQAMHATFLYAARADRPMAVRVNRIRDGRSFAYRRVEFYQDDRPVFCADVSFHNIEASQPNHQLTADSVPPPDSLNNLHELIDIHGENAFSSMNRSRAVGKKTLEVRPIDQLAGIVKAGQEPRADAWLRAVQFDSRDPLFHYAALAYLSDCWVNMACRIKHSPSLFSGETTTASLNHSIWFHRAPRADDWLLYLLDSPSTHGGVGFNRGLLYDRFGQLLASTAQEALVRWLDPQDGTPTNRMKENIT